MRLLQLIAETVGQPVLFHGSDAHFVTYSASKGRPASQRGDSFIYTTRDRTVAQSYGPKINRVIPSLTRPPLNLFNSNSDMHQVLQEFVTKYPNSRYAKWSLPMLEKIVLEGRMFVKDEYGNLQRDLLRFGFSLGYECIIIRDNSHGLHQDEQTWVFPSTARLKFVPDTGSDITERRIQNTEIMYHGTTDKYLRSILKQGLLANPPVRTYSGVDDMEDGYKTFGGVYLANNKRKAISAARDAVFKFGGQPLL